MTARWSSKLGEAAKAELGPWNDCRRPEAAECLRVNLCAQLRGTQASPRGGAEVPQRPGVAPSCGQHSNGGCAARIGFGDTVVGMGFRRGADCAQIGPGAILGVRASGNHGRCCSAGKLDRANGAA